MTQQPEALRLAALLDEGNTVRPTQISTPLSNVAVYRNHTSEAAAELRRLHAKTEDLEGAVNVLSGVVSERNQLEAQRDALLEALKLARSIIGHPDDAHTQMIDAAIKAVEGQK